MTDDMMTLRGLLEEEPDADLLRETIGFAAQRRMELAVGVNSDGRREVLGTDVGPSEAETFWTALLLLPGEPAA